MKLKACTYVIFYVLFIHAKESVSSFVDPNVVLQPNFKGWGTSLAWWADMVGGMESDVFDYVIDSLFSVHATTIEIIFNAYYIPTLHNTLLFTYLAI